MSSAIKKDIETLYEERRLTDFEYKQLLCLKDLSGKLMAIKNNMDSLYGCLKDIRDKLNDPAKK